MSPDTVPAQRAIMATAAAVTRLPAQDLDRARAWYRDRLGLEPVETREGGLLYHVGDSWFVLFASTGKASGTHTQMGFEVADLAAAMRELRSRGVVFDDEGMPGLAMVDGVVEVPGNYPSKGQSERGAWFRDGEGNLLGLGQPIDPPAVEPTAVVRALLGAWEAGDRPALEALLADDFHFFSPRDDGLDRDGYFATCWPNHDAIRAYDIVHLHALEPGLVMVTYEAVSAEGARFRNTELITLRDRLVTRVEVFFGRTL